MQLWWRCVAFQGLVTRIDVDPDARLSHVGRALSRKVNGLISKLELEQGIQSSHDGVARRVKIVQTHGFPQRGARQPLLQRIFQGYYLAERTAPHFDRDSGISRGARRQPRHTPMSDTFSKVEMITGVARRRRFSTDLKLAIVAETMQPGMSINYGFRRHGLSPSLVFRWRRLMSQGARRRCAPTTRSWRLPRFAASRSGSANWSASRAAKPCLLESTPDRSWRKSH